MAGNQSRGLIAASKTRGWDPTVIPAGNGRPAESIANFDKDQGNYGNQPGKCVGEIPGGHPDGWPDGYDVSKGIPSQQFNSPDVSRENAMRHTRNANPTPANPFVGKPGAGG